MFSKFVLRSLVAKIITLHAAVTTQCEAAAATTLEVEVLHNFIDQN